MFGWLKKRLVEWAERYQKREIERLHAEALRLKAEVLKMNGGQPILTAVKHEAYAVSGRSQKSLDHFTGHRSTRPRSECPENRYSGPDIFQLTISPLE